MHILAEAANDLPSELSWKNLDHLTVIYINYQKIIIHTNYLTIRIIVLKLVLCKLRIEYLLVFHNLRLLH